VDGGSTKFGSESQQKANVNFLDWISKDFWGGHESEK